MWSFMDSRNSAVLSSSCGFLACSHTHHPSTEQYKKHGRNFRFMGQSGNCQLLAIFTAHWRGLSRRQPVTGREI